MGTFAKTLVRSYHMVERSPLIRQNGKRHTPKTHYDYSAWYGMVFFVGYGVATLHNRLHFIQPPLTALALFPICYIPFSLSHYYANGKANGSRSSKLHTIIGF